MIIGIIGKGYVGSAVAASYPSIEILINDPALPNISDTIADLKKLCNAIFVCVPTPSVNGKCNTSILNTVLDELIGYTGIVIVKSTAPPSWYANAEKTYLFRLAHVPEFLTQARAHFDYVNPQKIVVGCKDDIVEDVTDVLMSSAINFDRVNIEYCSIAEASFFKYMANNFLAMKVIMNNEFAQLATALDLDWNNVTDLAKTDSRLGNTHWNVPGHDGSPGFGGACFPKDTDAMFEIAQQTNTSMTMLETAINTNNKLRN